ncbi:MAG: MBL fold metallo-hydrolase [Candidatus Bathyarchaeia archaeon]
MVDQVCLKVLVEDSIGKSEARKQLIAKHGFSIFVEAMVDDTCVNILMDTGSSPEALLNNVDVMGVNLRELDAILISHGHYDHMNGLISALKGAGKQIPVFIHPKAFNPKFSLKHKLKFIGSALNTSKIEEAGGIPILSCSPIKIAEGIISTGEIERVTSYEKTVGFYSVEEGHFVEDPLMDDQALIIELKENGLIVVTGCAHAGIVNTVLHAQKLADKKEVHAVLGGFHLINAAKERIKMTVNDLSKLSIDFLGPCHCTGKKAIKAFKEAFGDKCRPLKTGDIIKF